MEKSQHYPGTRGFKITAVTHGVNENEVFRIGDILQYYFTINFHSEKRNR